MYVNVCKSLIVTMVTIITIVEMIISVITVYSDIHICEFSIRHSNKL